MDSLQFYGDHLDENEEAEEESRQLQPDFSVNDVEIEEVTVVVETQQLEVEEVVTFENSTHDEENDLLYVEDRSNPDSKDLDGLERGEGGSADPNIFPEAAEGPQAPIPLDQVRELVDLNRDTCETDLNFNDSGDDELMAEQDEAPLEADTMVVEAYTMTVEADTMAVEADTMAVEADTMTVEAADEDTAMLQQTESDGEHAQTSDGVANEGVHLNALDMEADDHHLPLEPATEPVAAVSDGGLAGEDSLKVPAESAENETIVNEDANEKQTESSEQLETEGIANEVANEKQTEGSEHVDTEVLANEDANEEQADASEHVDTEVLANEDANEEQADASEHVDTEVLANEDANEEQTDASEHVDTEVLANEDANEEQTEGSEHVDTEVLANEVANEEKTDASEHVDTEVLANKDANEEKTDASEHVDTEVLANEDANEEKTDASEHADSGRKENNSNPEEVNKSDDDSAQAGDSAASKEIPSVNVGLGSASVPEELFNDANLAQLRAQILVMGILRKGSKPSDDLLKSACPTYSEGTPSATVAEDVDNAAIEEPAPVDPSSSRKRKSLENEAVPSENYGIATDLMMAVKDNLHLSPSRDVLLFDDTDRQLRSAQISAHDAMATATSALAQSHLAWAQIRCEDHSVSGIAREQQIASVAATVAAAASVAKAAVEAAKAIANVSIKAFMQGGQLQVANGQPSDMGKNMPSSTRRRSDMLASVVKAAGMAAEAATQAGTVLAFANPLIPTGDMEGLWTPNAGEANEADAQGTRAVKRKSKASPKTKATKKSKGHVSASPKTTPLKVSKGGSKKKNEVPKRSKIQKDNRQPGSPAKSTVSLEDSAEARDGGYINEKSECIVKGSVVEIMTEEEGLRGGWFSGKVLRVTKGQAFAIYDELLDDDGSTKIQEWFPFNASGDPAGPRRQVRPVHPYSSIRESGSKKRRRVSMGSQTWTIGDRVDAFIQDAWWEGMLVELNDIDESKATVYFPGENDTQIVKVWDLRPSMRWEDGKWAPLANSAAKDKPRKTQGKAGSSSNKAKDKPVKDKPIKDSVPKVTSKAKKAKETPKETQDASAKAAKAKERPKKTEDSSKEIAGTLPSRSTRQGNLQEMGAKVPNAKKSSKNVEVPVSEVDEPTPSRSTRKRKGPELSADVKKGKKNPSLLVLEEPVDAPTTTRSTRSSPMITAGKISDNKLSDKKNSTSTGKKAKDISKASQSKDTSALGAPKKLDLNVSTGKSSKKSAPAKVATANTRGKLKAEPEEKKRPRRR